jgi:hypothetical protein
MTAVGAKSIGPSGWVAIGGIVANGVLYALQQNLALLPPTWAGVVTGLIAVLTMVGVYQAPNHVLPAPPPPAAPPPAPASEPVHPWPEP